MSENQTEAAVVGDDTSASAGRTTSTDTFEPFDTNPAPLRPTFVDGTGVERIAGPPVSGWTPAPVEPSDEQVARMDEHNARAAERREARLGALTDTDRLGDTAQPLVDANAAAEQERQTARDSVPADQVADAQSERAEEAQQADQGTGEAEAPHKATARKHAAAKAEEKKDGDA